MTTLTVDQLEMPAVTIGPENPLPRFRAADHDTRVELDESISQKDRKYMGWETGYRVLPHRMQDNYDRVKKSRKFIKINFENEYVRAEFLPELGGRLISLRDKQSGIELLEPVIDFQPTNVALRDAWFAGGIEWNTAQMGHNYLTCSPVFATEVHGSETEPVLRLYAWERTKRFPYQIDFHLPSDSRFLFARVRIINPHNEELPMYWWTNIALPQSTDRRVIMPADSVIYNAPGGFRMVDLPMLDGRDLTYATNATFAKEYFFRIPETERPWIAYVDAGGNGLIHTSTARLRGRKMFAWGTSRGGQRWQEHLLGPEREYVEIQAGLARTQIESIPMPAGCEWTWTEAFGSMHVDPNKTHSTDWSEARTCAEKILEEMLPQNELNKLDSRLAEVTAKAPDKLIFAGDGWGSLEKLRQSESGLEQEIPPELPFPEECLGEDQSQWLSLLHDGALPERDVLDDPGCYMVQPEWQTILEESITQGKSDHWLGWLHLGVMKLENSDLQGARDAWSRSIECKPSGWAYRNLAVIEIRENNITSACDLMRKAWEIGPKITSLALEYADVLEKDDRWDDLRSFVDGLSEALRNSERMLIVSAKLALHFGDLGGVDTILNHDFASIREGEFILTDLWFAWQTKLISEKEGVPITDELSARVRKELTPPLRIDLRTAG